jgi:hypothetical protein
MLGTKPVGCQAVTPLLALAFVTACTGSAQSRPTRSLSIPKAEAALAKMFSDTSGKAEFSCTDGGDTYEFICQGRYVPIDRRERVVAHRIGASVSHYFEGEPVFAISVLRDASAQK